MPGNLTTFYKFASAKANNFFSAMCCRRLFEDICRNFAENFRIKKPED
jgi:hypothetical protein